jgi:hypothetical protein
MNSATALYRAFIIECERRRRQLGWPAWKLDDASGVQDGYSQKMAHPDSPSGRQARWETLQLIVDALFPYGFDLILRPKNGCVLDAASQQRKIRFAVATVDRKAQRELMRELGMKGGRARAESISQSRIEAIALKGARARAKLLPPEQRREQARLAAKARWSTPRVVELHGSEVTKCQSGD